MEDLVRAYRLYQQILRYPHLSEEIRSIFLSALREKGIASPESIRSEAARRLREEGGPVDEDGILEYSNALIDLHFARHFSQEEIENYINLARKEDAFQYLNKVLNTEGVTSREIQKALKEFCLIPQGGIHISPDEAEGVRVALINQFISSQLPFIGVSKNHITIRDIDEMIDHSIRSRRRTGMFGGKAAGMFLAYKIILPRLSQRDPELEQYVTIPESYYFSSGILSDFIDHNHFYSLHSQKYKSREVIEEEYANMAPRLEQASFPPDVVEDFRRLLEKIGEYPLILRSSSLLEDSFSYAFSGKYDSVFISNRGNLQTRLDEFIRAIKRILMSIFSPAAIMYRRDHGLLDFDERMSVLVQKVVGRRFGDYFFPFAAGVAFSQNVYPWTPRIKKEEGLVRLVLGLGTRAVDRVAPDYPRMVALSHPSLRPEVGTERVRKYSQKMVDVLNLANGALETIPYLDLFGKFDHPDLYHAVSTDEGGYLSAPLFPGQKLNLSRSCITFDNLLAKTVFVRLMKKVLSQLEKAYGRPVEVEFAWDQEKLYILQCRSLPVQERFRKVTIPEHLPQERILFTNNRSISNSIIKNIEFIVYVDPKGYAQLTTYEERMAIGSVVGRINRVLEGRRYALFGPSRWGSNDIKFGVKVGYGDINHTLILGEVAFEEKGSTPEVSFGTHFFNDLVEARIVPLAIYPDEPGIVFKESFMLQSPNLLSVLAPDLVELERIVHVIDIPATTEGRLLQVYQDGQTQQGAGFFAHPNENIPESD
jgi:hypothetical protein